MFPFLFFVLSLPFQKLAGFMALSGEMLRYSASTYPVHTADPRLMLGFKNLLIVVLWWLLINVKL